MTKTRGLLFFVALSIAAAFPACGKEPGPSGDGDGDAPGGAPGDGDTVGPCPAETYGPECAPCDCGDGVCNDGRFGDGSCSDCPDGLFGDACDEVCPDSSGGESLGGAGGYGNDLSECVSVIACNQQTGVPTNCDDCHPGFFGKQCSKVCADGTGNCLEVDDCTQGGEPTACSSCKAGFWGPNCEEVCDDVDNHCVSVVTCEQGTGAAVACKGCDPTWAGANCNQCARGWAGAQCDECAVGWSGKICDTRKIILYVSNTYGGLSPTEAAAEALGFNVTAVTSSTAFVATYDAEVWDLAVIDLPELLISEEVRTRLVSRINAGGAVLISYHDIESVANAAMMNALGVTPTENVNPHFLVVPEMTEHNVLDLVEAIPSPIAPTADPWPDDGDFLTAPPGGYVLLEDSVEGRALAVMNANRTQFVLGFLSSYYRGDADMDGKTDINELFTNILAL